MSAINGKTPWDRRLTERWARQAAQAANHPQRYARTPLREQLRSPYYSAGLALLSSGWMLDLTGASEGLAGVAAGLGGLLVFVAPAVERRRRSRARP